MSCSGIFLSSLISDLMIFLFSLSFGICFSFSRYMSLQFYLWFRLIFSMVFLLIPDPALSPVSATSPPQHTGMFQLQLIIAASTRLPALEAPTLCAPSELTLVLRRPSKCPCLFYRFFFQYSLATWCLLNDGNLRHLHYPLQENHGSKAVWGRKYSFHFNMLPGNFITAFVATGLLPQ